MMGNKDNHILCKCSKIKKKKKKRGFKKPIKTKLVNTKSDKTKLFNTKSDKTKLVNTKSDKSKHDDLYNYQTIPNLNPIINYMVNLGCLNNTNINDIVPVNIKWPINGIPSNLSSGASGPLYNRVNGVTSEVSSEVTSPDTGNPSSLDTRSIPTPFQSTVYLLSGADIYNVPAIANGYANITLSGEGLLWTLWPLAKKKGTASFNGLETYFDQFTFGTSLKSRYPIGQMGFFINNMQLGCTPFGSVTVPWHNDGLVSPLPNQGFNTGDPIPKNTGNPIREQPGLSVKSLEPGIKPGVQFFDETLLIDYKQHASIIVVKVSEEIARIFNPSAGISSPERYIYVGYDAWSIFRITSNPVGPMAAQTYISPQSVTGSVTGENLQVVVPPNFPHTIYYKNTHYFGHSQGVD